MPRRKSIAPENQIEQMFKDIKKSAKSNNTKPSGSKYIGPGQSIISENADGTTTVIGGNGIQEWVGDTTIPPTPAGITAQSNNGTVIVAWDGTLVDPQEVIPLDWSHIEVRANGSRQGDILGSRRSAMSFPATVGDVLSITVVAVDKAGNHSPASTPVEVTVTSVTGELSPEVQQQLDDNTAALEAAQLELADVGLQASNAETTANQAMTTAQAMASGNLVPVPSIKRGTGAWGSSFNIQDTSGFNGQGAYFFSDSTSGQTFFSTYPAGSIPVEEGKKYFVSSRIKSTVALNGSSPLSRMLIRAYTSSGTYTTVVIANAPSATANTWVKLSGNYVAQPGIKSLTIGYEVFGSFVGEILWSNPIVAKYLDTELIDENTIPGGKLLLNDEMNSKLGNFLQINGANITITETGQFNNLVAQKMASATADFQEVRVENLTAGTGEMDALVAGKISSAQLQAGIETAPGEYQGVRIDTQGITAWDGTPTPTFQLDSTTGDVTIRGGVIKTSPELNDGVEITEDGLSVWDQGDRKVHLGNQGDNYVDGSIIASGSITADKLSLIAEDQNIVPGGDGSDIINWKYELLRASTTGDPVGSRRIYGFKPDVRSAYPSTSIEYGGLVVSPVIGVSPGSSYELSYDYKGTLKHSYEIRYYNRYHQYQYTTNFIGNGTPIAESTSWTKFVRSSKIVIPDDAMYIQVGLRYEVTQGYTTTDKLEFANISLASDIQTMLTPTGMTSSNAGVETIRLNGENNLLIGEFLTGQPGVDPTIKISSRSNVGAIDFFGGPVGADAHGGVWWREGNVNTSTDAGLNLFAVNDSGSGATYSSGVEFSTDGTSRFVGNLANDSATFRPGQFVVSAGLGANGSTTLNHWLTNYNVTFPVAYPSGTVPMVFFSVRSTAASEVMVSATSITNTGMTLTLVNYAPRNTGTLTVRYLLVI